MDQDHEWHLRHDATRREEWGHEMLDFLREHDLHFERLRHETLSQMDADYRAWRRARAGGSASSVGSQESADPAPHGR